MTFAAPQMTPRRSTPSLIDFVFAEIWSRPGLSRRDRRFVTLACVAAADAEAPLRDHVYAALNSGDISITEMRETVLHFAVYAGWPKASRFNTWSTNSGTASTATAARPLRHLSRCCRWPTPSEPESTACRRGAVVPRPSTACLSSPTRDNPYSGAGILNFVFGEMWLRPGLGMKERRLITVTCVAFQDAPYPDPESRLRGIEESRRLVRRDGRTGIAFRGLLRLAQGVTPQPRDRATEAARARRVADRSGRSSEHRSDRRPAC